ncbi:EAL and HDOD domain-containing protein [Vibrio viridaestus]|uniref:EAL domain-containing protein n=1 Tax=Vibrio viridaestus TaxID=2487322 RepID=A0A3N9TG87_9VIBR|nr:EAL domain-containing protein [Vibrio viridaestus]RQW63281.1 EAL domain-containing protein [Vibrio viridaestus]
MQYTFIARQPILSKDSNLFGYELLFRDGPNNSFPNIDPTLATGKIITDNFLNVHNRVCGDTFSFVNFTYDSLIQEIPTLLPANKLVIEILETCQPTDELLSAVKSMRSKGYHLALDDFIPAPEWQRFLPYIDFIKFDISTFPIKKAQSIIRKLSLTKIRFLAERVETHEEFQEAILAGFDLFQGYFFSKPELLKNKKLEAAVMNVLHLFKQTTKAPLNYDVIESIISRDLSLSYKLLALVNNSPAIQVKINSFKQAIAYLGEEKLRKFIALLAITNVGKDKPQYLYGLSIQTARFCERIASETKVADSGSAFLTGMFCYLETLLEIPLSFILNELPIEDEVKAALLGNETVLGKLLKIALCYEHADWISLEVLATEFSLTENQISNYYAEAIQWTSELFVDAE